MEDCKHKVKKGQQNPSSGNKLDILITSTVSNLEMWRNLWGDVSTRMRIADITKMDLEN